MLKDALLFGDVNMDNYLCFSWPYMLLRFLIKTVRTTLLEDVLQLENVNNPNYLCFSFILWGHISSYSSYKDFLIKTVRTTLLKDVLLLKDVNNQDYLFFFI